MAERFGTLPRAHLRNVMGSTPPGDSANAPTLPNFSARTFHGSGNDIGRGITSSFDQGDTDRTRQFAQFAVLKIS